MLLSIPGLQENFYVFQLVEPIGGSAASDVQPQILRLRAAQRARRSPLRMTLS
jgi:hypothetical protein